MEHLFSSYPKLLIGPPEKRVMYCAGSLQHMFASGFYPLQYIIARFWRHNSCCVRVLSSWHWQAALPKNNKNSKLHRFHFQNLFQFVFFNVISVSRFSFVSYGSSFFIHAVGMSDHLGGRQTFIYVETRDQSRKNIINVSV